MKPKLRMILIGILFLFLGLLELCTGPLWWGCNPPYLLCATAVLACFAEEKTASLFGLAAGLIADFCSLGVFGIRAVLYLAIGYLTVFALETFLSRNVFSGVLLGILSVAVAELAAWGIAGLGGTVYPFAFAARTVFLPRLSMSVPVILLLYALFRVMYRERDSYPVRRRRRR